MAETKVKHRSVEERVAKGKGIRDKTPVSSPRAGFPPRTGRIRSRCSRNRTPPGNPTWCRCGTVG